MKVFKKVDKTRIFLFFFLKKANYFCKKMPNQTQQYPQFIRFLKKKIIEIWVSLVKTGQSSTIGDKKKYKKELLR